MCWDSLPTRPMNGMRETKLYMNVMNGASLGSYINFTCNDFYERVGPKTVFCDATGKWPKNTTACRFKQTGLCAMVPAKNITNGFLHMLSKAELKNETELNKFESSFYYMNATYGCFYGFKFNKTRPSFLKLVNSQLLMFQMLQCTSDNKWENLPGCIKIK